jgi:hypothetical protein
MTLYLTSEMVDRGAMYPERGRLFDVESGWRSTENICLLWSDKEYREEYEKGEWEYDSDEEYEMLEYPGEIKKSPCGNKYDEWEKTKIEEWWVTFGKMWLDGSYDRENKRFPYKIINPDAPDYMFVEALNFTGRGNYYTDMVWETDGINEDDYLLGEELGILTPRNAPEIKEEVDFNKMIDENEEINEEAALFLDEYDMICEGGCKSCEVIQLNEIREFVEVKIESIGKKFALGSINGQKEVFIPINVLKKSSEEQYSLEYFKDMNEEELGKRIPKKYDEKTSNINYGELKVGETCLMDVRYTGSVSNKKNIWRVVKIHPKIIHIKGIFIPSAGKKSFDIEMPLQNVCGKNQDFKDYRKKIVEEYPLMDEFWASEDYDHYCNNYWNDDYEKLIVSDMWYPTFKIMNTDVTNIKIFQDVIHITWPKYVECSCYLSDSCDLCKHEKEPDFKRYTLMSGFDSINGIVRKNMC